MAKITAACALAAMVFRALSFDAAAQPSVDATVKSEQWADPYPHRSDYVTVNSVRLNYLDWGGAGPALILIHGLQDSPHVFDDFAASLRHRFHIIAYARRGHGRSDAPAGPYNQEILVEDLRQLLDRLGVARAILLGWSMGGVEITEFAGRYPDRVHALVYLEAAYDWADPMYQKPQLPPPVSDPDSSDRRSLDTYRAWLRRSYFGDTVWTPGLEAYLRDIVRLGPDGRVTPVPWGPALDALFSSIPSMHLNYRQVKAPALALYAESFFPMDAETPELTRARHDFEGRVMQPFRQASVARLRRELPHVVVREFPRTAHLSILVIAQDPLTGEIQGFLDKLERQ